MELFGKVRKIFKEQGMESLLYVVSEKLKNRMSEQQKYAGLLRNESRKKQLLFPGEDSFEDLFTVVVTGTEVFSKLDEVITPYVAFLEEGDRLENDWQKQAGAYLKRHPSCKFLYSDEDVVEEKGKRTPIFKPDWSPDTYMSYDYVGGLLILERELAVDVKEQIHHKYKESFLYEMGLRAAFSLKAEEIGHLDYVLYHRYVKKEIPKEELLALKEAVLRVRCLKGKVFWRSFEKGNLILEESWGKNPMEENFLKEKTEKQRVSLWGEGCADVIYEVPGEPLVSIVVPSKDHWQLLKTCVESVEKYTTYPNVEWIVVDNGSNEENKKKYQEICDNTRFSCKYLYEPMEFNFSRMCNIGAKAAAGEYLLFLNDDMELIPNLTCEEKAQDEKLTDELELTEQDTSANIKDWLTRLLGQAALPHTGAVGAKLLYPNSKMIQHLGVVNYTSGAAHLLWQASDSEVLPFGRNHTTQNYSVVTGACLLVNTEKFWQAGGFEERLAVTFNDVELCLKLLEAGYYQTVRSDVVLYHHESISRGQDVLDQKKFLRGLKERENMFDLHPDLIGVDPFYNKRLTQTRLDHTLDYPVKYQLSKEVAVAKDVVANEAAKVATDVTKESANEKSRAIIYRILRITLEEDVCIEGWAYRKGHGYEPITVILTDASGVSRAFSTRKVYTPTITKEQESEKNLNFAGFECRLSREALDGGKYNLALQVGNERVDVKEVDI